MTLRPAAALPAFNTARRAIQAFEAILWLKALVSRSRERRSLPMAR
jgi:hypothetical protein